MIDLDLPAAVVCLELATVLFALHVLSSPRRASWMTLPDYVRHGLVVTGAMFLWRGVNFLSIAGSSVPLGHINAEGMMAQLALAYTVTALAVWLYQKRYPVRVWDRLRWVEREEARNPDLAPLLMPTAQVADVARLAGAEVATPPGAPVQRIAGELNDVDRDGAGT